MKVNVGVTDKSVRIVVGAALIVLTLMGTIGVWGWIGIVPFATGLLNFCPLYSLLGVNCSGLIKPDTFLGGNITTMKEVFNDKHTTIVYNRL